MEQLRSRLETSVQKLQADDIDYSSKEEASTACREKSVADVLCCILTTCLIGCIRCYYLNTLPTLQPSVACAMCAVDTRDKIW